MRTRDTQLKGLLLLVALTLHLIFGGELYSIWRHSTPWFSIEKNILRDLIFGVFIGVMSVTISRIFGLRTALGGALEEEMQTIYSVRQRHPLRDAFGSACMEEVIFRGILLSWLDIIPSALIFAITHLPLRRGLIIWMITAFAFGLMLCALFMCGLSLVAPLTAHFVINFLNLNYLERRARATVFPGIGQQESVKQSLR